MPPESPLPRPVRLERSRPSVAPSLAERAAAIAGGPAFAPQRAAPAPHGPAARRPARGAHGPAPTSEVRPAKPTPVSLARGLVILGIDPGTRVVGWGAIELTPAGPRLLAVGVVRAGSGDLPGRLGQIRRELDRVIELHRPGVVAVEEAFAHKNVQSALRIGEGRGVVLSCAAAAGITVHQYPPAAAKKAIVGNGAAHKSQVAAMVARRLGLTQAPEPMDASDALALALTHVLRKLPRQC